MEPSAVKPCLKVVGLHVEGLRALRRVDWPADGIGWNGRVPDLVMVGGVNGSGKTTLLEHIAVTARVLRDLNAIPLRPTTMSTCVDLTVSSQDVGVSSLSVVISNKEFVGPENKTDNTIYLSRQPSGYARRISGTLWGEAHSILANSETFSKSDFPGIVYMSTDRRLDIPHTNYKSAGSLAPPSEFFYQFSPAKEWSGSLEALLYSARWMDLNAKEEGHPELATHFESYAKAFQAFFGDSKSLVWEGGELFVKIADTGARHPLMALSSGEKQALILAAELYRRWRPGSLILIDEPELHFHTSWQTTLWTMLERWQKERGGQVIVATQSTHLFRIADPETTVLLGGPLA
jgi:energy-coupling factor transporter ATP-binding protein EcfA2